VTVAPCGVILDFQDQVFNLKLR